VSLATRVATATVTSLVRLMCRVHGEELRKVPAHGPLILTTNHVNFLEIPVLFTYLRPRKVIPLAKAETWDNPLLGFLFDMGHSIPVRRGTPDVVAIRRALDVLSQGSILALAPEGTRSNTGRLQSGKPGVGLLALKSGAPLLPLVFFGGERYRENLARLKRTDFFIRVGSPFYIHAPGDRVQGASRQKLTDEVMYQLAALLPPAYRGVYSDLTRASESFLKFESPSHSNLQRIH
jgi:1-acyl-sn-glycerol-3-phosphate acyltransferase